MKLVFLFDSTHTFQEHYYYYYLPQNFIAITSSMNRLIKVINNLFMLADYSFSSLLQISVSFLRSFISLNFADFKEFRVILQFRHHNYAIQDHEGLRQVCFVYDYYYSNYDAPFKL